MKTRVLFGVAAVLVASVAIGAGDEAAHSKPGDIPAIEAGTCGPGGIDVTVALAYNRDTVGMIAAAHVDLGVRKPLGFPDDAPEKRRARLKSLLGSEYHVNMATQEKPDKVRVTLTTTEPGFASGNVFTLRFDCTAGSQIRPGEISCSTSEVVDGAGMPMDATLAKKVGCVVAQLEPVTSE